MIGKGAGAVAARQPAVVNGRVAVRLAEWESLRPEASGPGAALRGLTIGDDPRVHASARDLARVGVVTVTELRDGLRVEAGSFVGRLAIGPLEVTIVPKVAWGRWQRLFGYALRLRDVVRSEPLAASVAQSSLHDLIALELVAEARDLLGRGLHKEYEAQRRPLAVPRGRMDFGRIARNGGLTDARVPSRFTRRLENTLLNRALLAALRAAASVATDPQLRGDAHRLAHELSMSVAEPPLTADLLRAATQAVDRRTARYAPALRLGELLRVGQAVTPDSENDEGTVSIPGFAIDMNGLWQRLLGRVLTEWVPGVNLLQEVVLGHLFRNVPAFTPRPPRIPRPRPDFAVTLPDRGIVYLDAKYRDLWSQSLPREMLYQLALYAAAQSDGAAAMLYPTDEAEAAEERLEICSPGDGRSRATVALRPVHLGRLEELVTSAIAPNRGLEREHFARRLPGLAVPTVSG